MKAALISLLVVFSDAFHIHPMVTEDVKKASFDNPASFLVVLKETPSLHAVAPENVFHHVAQHAKRSQASLMNSLTSHPMVVRTESVTVANAMIVDVTSEEALEMLRNHDSVLAVEPNRPFRVKLPRTQTETESEEKFDGEYPEWNLNWVGAPAVWQSHGNGTGMVYANADTGVLWTHESLISNYIGSDKNHNYAWFDGVRRPLVSTTGPCGIKSVEPCDDNGHGTHTTSTAIGSKNVGVAPGAKWMACRNMDQGYGSSETYLNCLDFFFAPTDLNGENPDPSRRPHVIGNSYGCPKQEGCAVHAFTRAVENLRKAGIFMSVSAGNEGPSCSTVQSPPGYEPAVISVGALSYRSHKIAYFSSRGPSYHLGAGKSTMKPDMVAPGSQIRAAYPRSRKIVFQNNEEAQVDAFDKDSNYAHLSGTSMASPHVAGAAILLNQVCSCMERNIDKLQHVMEATAKPYRVNAPETWTSPCGNDAPDAVPNNVYGHGGLNIQKAVELCLSECQRG